MNAYTIKKYSVLAIVMIAAILSAMAVRASRESVYWFQLGMNQESAGDTSAAIESFRRSESWFLPGFDTSQLAYEELQKIAHTAGISDAEKMHALVAAKRGLRSSRSMIDGSFGRKDAATATDDEMLSHVPESEKAHAIVEAVPPHINYGYQIVAQLFFLGWIGTVFFGIWRAFGSSGTADYRKLTVVSIVWVVLFAGWLVALRLA